MPGLPRDFRGVAHVAGSLPSLSGDREAGAEEVIIGALAACMIAKGACVVSARPTLGLRLIELTIEVAEREQCC